MSISWTTAADWDAATAETTVSHPGDSVALADGALTGSLTTASQTLDNALVWPKATTSLTSQAGTTVTVSLTDGTTTSSERHLPPVGDWGDDCESGFGSEWTVHAAQFQTKTNRVYEGGQSFGIQQGNASALLAEATPAALSDGSQIAGFRFYWQETSASWGAGVRLINSNGDPEVSFATDNPQWLVHDGNGTTQIKGDDGRYGHWVEVRIVFDWSAGTATIRAEELESGTVKTHSGPLKHSVDIETISIENYDSGSSPPWAVSDCYMWFDGFAVEPASATHTETFPSSSVAADANCSVTLDIATLDAARTPSVESVTVADTWTGATAWTDDFTDADLDGWTTESGSWTNSDNCLESTGSGLDQTIYHESGVTEGIWEFDRFHGDDSLGGTFMLTPDAPPWSGLNNKSPTTGYRIYFVNQEYGRERYLECYHDGTKVWSKQLVGTAPLNSWNSYRLEREADGDGYRWRGYYDGDLRFEYRESASEAVENLEYLYLHSDGTGHQFDNFVVKDATISPTVSLIAAPATADPTATATTTDARHTTGSTSATATGRIVTDGQHTTPTTTALRAGVTTYYPTSRSLTQSQVEPPPSAPDLLRVMPVAPVETGTRARAVHRHHVFDGAIEHNDAAREEALTIERTAFPGHVRRVPSSPDVRLRSFATVTTASHRRTALAPSLAALARHTTDQHTAAPLAVTVWPLVAQDASYRIGLAMSRLDAHTTDRTLLSVEATAAASATTSATVTTGTHSLAEPAVALFAPYRPIGNDTYPLTAPTVSAETGTTAGKTMASADAQAVVSARTAARATDWQMSWATVVPLALVLDAKTSYRLALVAVDIFGEDGEAPTLQPHDSVPGGIDTTEDVIFGSRDNGFSMQ